MMFYVYMQPEVIRVARANGPYAIQTLIAFVRGTVQNCCVAVFEDHRTQDAIKSEIGRLPEDFDRKVLTSLLATLAKRNRFIYVLTPDYASADNDLSVVLRNSDQVPLDLLLLEVVPADGLPAKAEVSILSSYQHTAFELERSRVGNEGSTLAPGQLSEKDILDRHLKNALQFASRIEICDRILGRQFGDNFEYTIRILLQWLEAFLAEPSKCTMTLHVGVPQKATLPHIQTQLAAFRQGRLAPMPIEIHVYDVPAPDQCLPHERFILTDQIALEIGRGMDFLDRATHRNRDVSIGYKSQREVQTLLLSYAPYKQQPVTKF